MTIITIYSIKNKINGKVYIGKTCQFEKRIYTHFYTAKKGASTPLYDDIKLYGEKHFDITIVDTIKVTNPYHIDGFNLETQYIKSVPKELRYNKIVKGECTHDNLSDSLKQRPIIATDIETGDTIYFDSIYAAAIALTGKGNTGNISAVLSPDSNKKTAYGYKFKYA